MKQKKKEYDKAIVIEYFSKKAPEYEEVYAIPDPIRLKEQEIIEQYITNSFTNRYVLEIACGTGYWTKHLLKSAQKVVAIDASDKMLEISSKQYASYPQVNFFLADAYNPPISFPPFSGTMANFWFSHVPKKNMHQFLDTLHSRLSSNAFVLFVDSNFRGEESGKFIQKKGTEDTWKRRKLQNGEEYDVLKNYFTKNELEDVFSKYAKNLDIQYLTNFWIAGYHLKK